jgi:integrase/recombinase XerD
MLVIYRINEEFLQARSLSANSKIAYRRDLKHFLRWITIGWAAVTPRQVAQFKAHLLRIDSDTNRRVLADSSVCRILGTLKNFYGWSKASILVPIRRSGSSYLS